MRKLLFALCAALCAVSCSSMRTTYIGKSYPSTEAPEIYMSWDDVPCAFETMGYITATPYYFKTLEDAQVAVEQKAREKGADAVVFQGIREEVSDPTYTTTEKIERHEDGSKTRTATTQRNSYKFDSLEATFIKYRK